MITLVPVNVLLAFVALAIDIGGKWALLGRRTAGVFSWDQSSYCQRWQLYLTLQEIVRGDGGKDGILSLVQGSQYLVWYFRLLGCKIGNNVCLYPTGGDPMMTEPDMVQIGDRTIVDDASLVAHINTRGEFRLNPVMVGCGCVLKSASRLLSGATMENHSIIQEHTLVLSGERVDRFSVWQGWPSNAQTPLEVHRAHIRQMFDTLTRERVMLMTPASSYNSNMYEMEMV